MDACQDEEIIWLRCYTKFRHTDEILMGYGIRGQAKYYNGKEMPEPSYYVDMFDIHGKFKEQYLVHLWKEFTPTKEEVLAWQVGRMKK